MRKRSIVGRVVWHVAPSCWNQSSSKSSHFGYEKSGIKSLAVSVHRKHSQRSMTKVTNFFWAQRGGNWRPKRGWFLEEKEELKKDYLNKEFCCFMIKSQWFACSSRIFRDVEADICSSDNDSSNSRSSGNCGIDKRWYISTNIICRNMSSLHFNLR